MFKGARAGVVVRSRERERRMSLTRGLARGMGVLRGRTNVMGSSTNMHHHQVRTMGTNGQGGKGKAPGAKLRELVDEATATGKPLQIVGAVNAYCALMAEKKGHKALYLSGGGVALSSLGYPDLGVTTLEDVLVSSPTTENALTENRILN